METEARLTLEYSMNFAFIGEHLTVFGGLAPRDLVRYHKRFRDSLMNHYSILASPHQISGSVAPIQLNPTSLGGCTACLHNISSR